MFRLLAVFALTPCFGVGTQAPMAPPPREVVYYFPTKVGAKWVRLWSDGKGKDAEAVYVVTAVEEGKDGAKRVTVSAVGRNGKPSPFQEFEVSSKGLFYTRWFGFGRPVLEPQCELKLPHKAGQEWGDDESSLKEKQSAHGPEKVKVPAGEFDCIRVEYRDSRSPDPTQTRWYAPGVGLVKLTSGNTLIVLKSFTPGKE